MIKAYARSVHDAVRGKPIIDALELNGIDMTTALILDGFLIDKSAQIAYMVNYQLGIFE